MIIELFCFHCKKYFHYTATQWLRLGDYYLCSKCDKTNVLEGRAIDG